MDDKRALTQTEIGLLNAESALNRADDIRNRDRWGGDRAVDSAYHVAVAQVHATMALTAAQMRLAAALEEANRATQEAAADREAAAERSALRQLYNKIDVP